MFRFHVVVACVLSFCVFSVMFRFPLIFVFIVFHDWGSFVIFPSFSYLFVFFSFSSVFMLLFMCSLVVL